MATDPLEALRLPVIPVEPRPEFTEALRRRLLAATEPSASRDMTGSGTTVRYFVEDLGAAISFYCRNLGFEEELRSAPDFAMLYRGDLRLLLSVPGGRGAGRSLPDGTLPGPGGWNRLVLNVPDIAAAAAKLRRSGVRFRSGIATGVAVIQVLLEDPSGNLIELIEPRAGYHERKPS
ncbi:MAG TPA: VOC family protein [Streptosporangiaceae bacterium]|jgi:catechol 2,3-dioxygenase-like lactoylglutathione lyase family enzyme|nr:VOC family protein [Streptosporangiaceae bacterium]